MREKILSCLGGFPRKTELDFKVDLTEDKGDYYLNRVSYNVEENQRVNSFLLEPKELRAPGPAVVAAHQHAGQWHLGKSEVIGAGGDPMYAYAQDLVKRGYVVIAPDMLCFEERIDSRFADTAEKRAIYERFEFCRYIEQGSCLQTKYLHDLSVALDVLAELDCVDRNNIGVIGHSLGGQQAAWLTWYDKRIKAAVCSCGISTAESVFRNGIIHNFAMYVPGLLSVCDMDGLVSEIAPRAFFMTNGTNDEELFPIDGVKLIAEKASAAYARSDAENRFKSVIFNGGHSFGDNEKAQAYAWLDKHLR